MSESGMYPAQDVYEETNDFWGKKPTCLGCGHAYEPKYSTAVEREYYCSKECEH